MPTRMEAIKESGCVACMLATRGTQAPEVHHITSGGRRLGDDKTIGLCPYHHRGYIMEGQSKQSMMGVFGPSLAFGKRTFNEFFGSEEILWRIQNYILDEFAKFPWYDYVIPHDVRRSAHRRWTKEKES